MLKGTTVYKLVRIVDGKYLSANTEASKPSGCYWENCLEYKIGETTYDHPLGGDNEGLSAYETFALAKGKKHGRNPSLYRYGYHIRETMHSFNEGRPVAILKCRTMATSTPLDSLCYLGAIRCPALQVISLVEKFTSVPKEHDES